jgi:diaminohydroxyphosphoribosylaminopyrimidine deaminase / 5-amino-6-(5-phosphoribosylamino)uracil reductase
MTAFTPDDEKHLRRALTLAARGQGRVEPNPMVGCVIVKHGRVIGEGYHRRYGGPHAEVDALRHCSASPRGATAYVTLEPCCHFGKTPPCTHALLAAGIARVVAAMGDPNPQVAGGGFALLKKAGVRVEIGLFAQEAAALNDPFIKLIQHHRPWVILKWAQSLDGKIATHTSDSKWITDEVCRAHAHRTRGRVDAVLVGVGTVLTDDPMLTCRVGRPKRVAARVVLDSQLRTPLRSQLVQTARRIPTWILHGRNAPPRRARALEKAGCVLHRLPQTRRGLALSAVLDLLGQHRMTNVLVEGGGAVLGTFFDQNLADEFRIYVAPILIGGSAATGPLNAQGAATVSAAPRFLKDARLRPLGTGYFLRARP